MQRHVLDARGRERVEPLHERESTGSQPLKDVPDRHAVVSRILSRRVRHVCRGQHVRAREEFSDARLIEAAQIDEMAQMLLNGPRSISSNGQDPGRQRANEILRTRGRPPQSLEHLRKQVGAQIECPRTGCPYGWRYHNDQSMYRVSCVIADRRKPAPKDVRELDRLSREDRLRREPVMAPHGAELKVSCAVVQQDLRPAKRSSGPIVASQ